MRKEVQEYVFADEERRRFIREQTRSGTASFRGIRMICQPFISI